MCRNNRLHLTFKHRDHVIMGNCRAKLISILQTVFKELHVCIAQRKRDIAENPIHDLCLEHRCKAEKHLHAYFEMRGVTVYLYSYQCRNDLKNGGPVSQ
jgi:hypothetical protein